MSYVPKIVYVVKDERVCTHDSLSVVAGTFVFCGIELNLCLRNNMLYIIT